jgi:protein-tyrosine-phosphatase
MTMRHPKTVLVLCTGNSCRSQMGEAILNHDLAGLVRGISAGTSPQAKVADGAIQALKLAGLPTEGLYPKTVEEVMDQDIDLVVSVCDNAKETCPVFRVRSSAYMWVSMTRTASRWKASSRCVTTFARVWCLRYAQPWVCKESSCLLCNVKSAPKPPLARP